MVYSVPGSGTRFACWYLTHVLGYLATVWIKTDEGMLNLNEHLIKEGLAEAKVY